MQDRFLRACRREAVDTTPVWFMRQAGRALPEYRAIREQYGFMDICYQPELCAEVTLQPVRRLGVDAAIMFADIMTPLIATGVGVDLVESIGPVVANPIRTMADVSRIRPIEPEVDVPYISKSIHLLKAELGQTPLIGFAGAPFTLAAYLVEGKGSKNFLNTKAMMYGSPNVWHALMERLADLTISYLRVKLTAGVDALQLFDSWVGCLSPHDYATFVQPYTARILKTLREETSIPLIHFGTNTTNLLPLMRNDGGSVLGADWRIPIDEAWQLIGNDKAIQGNLDPAVLLGPWEYVREQAADILRRIDGRPGHIFNLGHGIHPQTPVANLERLVAFVHEHKA
ncbi:uroporphyrinogen decarboxylase [Herpetosiphon giganteus]|uniref:uroporphyrinogen decarboxylase n=1 Tax=Herpetosiphon giganteus TaxID=2029754 RepID=UPI00195AE91F|nr:uroporphyrinogen decarboxylase [Herpetosiphon giganteus]MBM7843094.1 uroporphyrinogen decarboxylase [Herpetosiphon giganteus]